MPESAHAPVVTTGSSTSQRPHRAARIEDRWRAVVSRFQKARGWRPRVEPFTGYGSARRVRVLGRVLLASPAYDPATTADRSTRTALAGGGLETR